MNPTLKKIVHVENNVMKFISKRHKRELSVNLNLVVVKCDVCTDFKLSNVKYSGLSTTGSKKPLIHSKITGSIDHSLREISSYILTTIAEKS